MILLDTDICVALLRGHRPVLDHRLATDDEVAVAFMTAAELYYGAEKSARPLHNRALVEEFLLSLPVLQTDLAILRRFGALKAGIERSGLPLPDADILIAATALSCCDRLATGNAVHFRRFPELQIENWLVEPGAPTR